MTKPILWIFLLLPFVDNLTKEQRRKNMQNIRSAGTKPERLIMRELKRKKSISQIMLNLLLESPILFLGERKLQFL